MKIDNWESIGEREKLAETRIFSVYKQKKRITSQGKVKLKYFIKRSLKVVTSLNFCHFPQNDFQTE